MEPRDLIKLLEINNEAADELTTRLIEQLKERGAIIDDLEALQIQQLGRQQAQTSLIVEAAMLTGELEGKRQRRALLGRMYGVVH